MFFPYFIILLYIHMCTVQCLICKYLYSGVSNWTGRWRGDTRCIHPSFLSDFGTLFTAYHLHSKRSVSGERNKEVRRKSKHQAKWYRRNRLQWTYMYSSLQSDGFAVEFLQSAFRNLWWNTVWSRIVLLDQKFIGIAWDHLDILDCSCSGDN